MVSALIVHNEFNPEIGDIVKGYEIRKYLGGGDYGRVFRVKSKETGVDYAMKVVDLVNEQLTENIVREINILQSMKHDNTVRLMETFVHRGCALLVMEFMEKDLRAAMEKGVTPEQAKVWLKQLLSGLDFLHSKGIIHRDLNPSNILLDGSDNLKIADFGFARSLYAGVPLTPEERRPIVNNLT